MKSRCANLPLKNSDAPRYLACVISLFTVGCRESDGSGSVQAPAIIAAPLTAGNWTPVAAPYPGPGAPAAIQLLMDGTVLVNDSSIRNVWRRFLPASDGSYAQGTWMAGTISSRFGRNFFPMGILKDGKVFVGGGEDVFDSNNNPITNRANPNDSVDPNHSKCELFDPNANAGQGSFSDLPDFPGSPYLGDGILAPFPDGRLLVTPARSSAASMVFDSSNLAAPWSTSTIFSGFNMGEGSLTPLQNGQIFFAGNNNASAGVPNGTTSGAAVYNTSTNTWTNVSTPAGYVNPFNFTLGEGGPALTLYDGTVMITGARGFNARFDPTSNTLSNLANTPGSAGSRMDENDQVVLPNGNVLCAVLGANFTGPFAFFEYSPPPVDQFTSVQTNAPALAAGNLVQTPLPDGSVMLGAASSNILSIYRPSGGPFSRSNGPKILGITGPVNGLYTVTGTGLNGLTNGANRDDEGQNFTTFPSIFGTMGTAKQYAVLTGVSTTSIATNAFVTTTLRWPAGLTPAWLVVGASASGLQGSNTVVLNPVLSAQREFLME